MKSLLLKIENIGDDVCSLMSRGHHDIHKFMAAVRTDGYDWELGTPRHVWFRTTPMSDGRTRYTKAKEGSRGAFPATYTTEVALDEIYEIEVCPAHAALLRCIKLNHTSASIDISRLGELLRRSDLVIKALQSVIEHHLVLGKKERAAIRKAWQHFTD